MSRLFAFIHRVIARRKPQRRRVEYIREGALPDDSAELIRVGAIEPWRTSASGELWFCILARPTESENGQADV